MPRPAPDLLAELRAVWALAWPVSLGMLAMLGMNTVDTLLVSPLGKEALGTLVLANMWFFGVSVVAHGALRAVDPLVAQAHGANDRAAIVRVTAQAIGLALLLTPPTMAALFVAQPGLRALGQPTDLLPATGAFCALMALGVPAQLVFIALRQVLQARGVVRPTTIVLVLANVFNAAFVSLMVYGFGLGALGCAAATATAQYFMLGALLWLAREPLREVLPPGWREHLTLRPVLGLVRTGFPLGVQMGMEAWAFLAAGLMMGAIGEGPLAAHGIVINLASLAFMVPLGVSAGAATRVGNLVGAERPWRTAALASILLGGGIMAGSAAVFALLPGPLTAMFQPEADVAAVCVALLPIAAAFQLFDGLQVVAFGVLRGAGDLLVPSLANLVGYWVVGLPFGAWLAFTLGWGPVGVWTGLAAGLACVATLLLFRLVQIARAGVRRLEA